MEEEFQLDLEIDDSVIDNASRKLQAYERQLKRVSALSKRSGSGIRTGGGIGAGSVGAHAGSLGGSQMLTQLASQVGAMKLGSRAMGLGGSQAAQQAAVPATRTPLLGHIGTSAGASAGGFRTPLLGHIGASAGAGAGGFRTFTKEQAERRRERRSQAAQRRSQRNFFVGGMFGRSKEREEQRSRTRQERAQQRRTQRASRGGMFGSQAGGFAQARGRQFGDQLGKGNLNASNLARGAVGGAFRRGGSVIGGALGAFGGVPGFIIGGMIGAAIGGLGDQLFSKINERKEAGRQRTAELRATGLSGEISDYVKGFSTTRLEDLRDYNEMARQALRDDVSLFTWWGSRELDGFWGPGWSNRNITTARKQAETEFSRRRQGIQDIDMTEMNYNRIEDTLRMMVRQ